MKERLLQLVPWLLLALFATEIVAILLPKTDPDFRLQDFGRLPVLLNGRVQPFDTVGRNALLQIRGTAAVPLEEKKSYEFWKHPKKLKATEWLLEVMVKPEQADTRPVFLIHHPDLLNELDLRGKGKEKSGLFYFSFNELTHCLEKIDKGAQQVLAIEPQNRNAYQKQLARLHNALSLYHRLKNSLQPENCPDLARNLDELKKSVPAGLAAVKAREAGQSFDQAAFDTFAGLLGPYELMSRLAYPLAVPPAHPEQAADNWQNMGETVFEAVVRAAGLPPAVDWFAAMASAYRQGNPAEFNRALAEYRQWLGARMPADLRKGGQEFLFNNLQLFLHSMIIYLAAFVLAAGAMAALSFWPGVAESLRRSAFYLMALAWIVHTAGLFFRMYLERRPPVTNLYSSAVFIGWMSALLGLILERVYRVGLGAAVGSLVGFITLIIAHNLALAAGGETMEMLRAVLDTNFWLATHVVTITLGYAANFMAGLLGLVYVLLGVFTPLLAMKLRRPARPAAGAAKGPGLEPALAAVAAAAPPREAAQVDLGQALNKMVYGIVCFATLFSFVGTVLGGIWADQSWGRFWGWDPKENGALIIVLWNALILHARWDGLVRERGLMNLAIFGNVVTAFSWFGVNMLGVGLHFYGFMDAAFVWLVLFILSQLVAIALGLLPFSVWRSSREAPADVREASPQAG